MLAGSKRSAGRSDRIESGHRDQRDREDGKGFGAEAITERLTGEGARNATGVRPAAAR